MHIKFYERNSKTYVRVADKGVCYRICTRALLNTRRQSIVKKQIQDLFPDREAINRLFLPPEPEPDTYDIKSLMKKYHELAKAGIITKRNGKRIQDSTLTSIEYIYKLHRQYGKPLDIREHALTGDFEQKKKIRDSFMKYVRGFESFLSSYSNKSRSTIIATTNFIIKYWADELFIQIPKLRYVYNDPNPIITLPDDVVKELFEDKRDMSNELKMVWELCVTILVTTLRIGDAIAITDKHINDGRLTKHNKKTGATTYTPLPKFLLDIYQENLKRNGKIYTIFPNLSKIYANIPELFKRYPSAHREMSFELDGVMVTKPVYEWVKPHMLRKTAITNMIAAGVPDREVKLLSGHTANSGSFELYVAFNQRKHQESIKKYHEQL